MSDEIIIPGGEDAFGHRIPDFVVGDEHTVFEWCMIYTDRHPGFAAKGATAAGQNDRLAHLGAIGPNIRGPVTNITTTGGDIRFDEQWYDRRRERIANALYRDFADGIQTRRFDPKKRIYLDDRPGELDPTLCVLDAEPILDTAERRGDGGEFIQKLLIAREVRPGQKAGAQTPKARAWEIALGILEDEARRPPRRHGRLTKLAGMVNVELTKRGPQYKNDSVRRMINWSVREWERKHPDK